MNREFVNILLIVTYLVAGTGIVAWLVNWALKRFGPPK